MPRALLTMLLSLTAGHAIAGDTITRDLYVNERYGTILDLPAGFHPSGSPPANGDGRAFEDGRGARLTIFANAGPPHVARDFAAYRELVVRLAANDEKVRVTYQSGGRDWFVYSGLKDDDRIVYVRVIHRCGAAHHVEFEYPADQRDRYQAVDRGLAQALRCRG
jgi:hypothetical protein